MELLSKPWETSGQMIKFDGYSSYIQSYQLSLSDIFSNYLDLHKRYYSTERRWPHAPFWQRRL